MTSIFTVAMVSDIQELSVLSHYHLQKVSFGKYVHHFDGDGALTPQRDGI
jgi:hypothetical protein